MKNHQKSMLRGTLLVKQALIMHLIRLISSLSKNPRIKVCAMQKRSPVPIFNPKLLIPDVPQNNVAQITYGVKHYIAPHFPF